MSRWYEVFDNEEVQRLARNRRMLLVRGLALVSILTLLLLGYAIGHPAAVPVTSLIVAGLWVGACLWWIRTDEHLRRIVWCVKISDRHIVGYDYARRKTEIDWVHVRTVRLTPSGLNVESRNGPVIEIPHLFPDFSVLSHRIVEYAELYGAPVCVDRVPWQHIDVHELYPYIEGDETVGGSGHPQDANGGGG